MDFENGNGNKGDKVVEASDPSKSRTAMMKIARPAVLAALAGAGFDVPTAVAGKDATTLRRFLRAMAHIGLAPCLDAGAPPDLLAGQLIEALKNELEERASAVKANLAEAKGGGTVIAFPNKGDPMPN
jgi:hypothetical protein